MVSLVSLSTRHLLTNTLCDRLAQWEGVSRKWYFVQRATGKSQWEIPTEPVILTPSTTPGSIGAGPTQAPRGASPAVSPIEGMNYSIGGGGANRGIFSHGTERAGLSVRLDKKRKKRRLMADMDRVSSALMAAAAAA